MFFKKKKYKIFYVLENKSLSSKNAVKTDKLNDIYGLLKEVKKDYYLGIYMLQAYTARVLITWNSNLECYNFDISFGDDGLFKNVDKQGAIDILDNFDDVVNNALKYGFSEEQAPW